jgi:hypothetical protein
VVGGLAVAGLALVWRPGDDAGPSSSLVSPPAGSTTSVAVSSRGEVIGRRRAAAPTYVIADTTATDDFVESLDTTLQNVVRGCMTSRRRCPPAGAQMIADRG